MIHSNLEPVIYKTAAWLTAYLQGYITNATAERAVATYPSVTDFPSILDYPDDDYTPPALKRAAVGSVIPPSGPFPYLLLVLDGVVPEWSGQNSENLNITMKAIVAIQENNDRKLGIALMRYMDGLIQALGANITLDGIFDEIKITNIDKDELPANKVGFLIADLSARLEIVSE